MSAVSFAQGLYIVVLLLIKLLLLAVAKPSKSTGSRKAVDFLCRHKDGEDWPAVQRQLLRLLDGGASFDSLAPQLSRATDAEEGWADDCLPGRVALRFLLLVAGPVVSPVEAGHLLGAEWLMLSEIGWVSVIRSGWPVFRLLRLLQRRVGDVRSEADMDKDAQLVVDGCHELNEPYAALLMQQVRKRHLHEGQSLLASSAAYLAAAGSASSNCPLSTAAAFLAGAWSRFPVYDAETEDMLRLAEPLVSRLDLAEVLATEHALLDVLDDVASSYQAFLIDSGALYEDLRPSSPHEAKVDYTRHMMNDRGAHVADGRICSELSAQTPLGHCNPFAPLGTAFAPWRERGVTLYDTMRAFRTASARHQQLDGEDPQVVLIRLLGWELIMVAPEGGNPMHSAQALRSEAVTCLAQEILFLLQRVPLLDVDIVVDFSRSSDLQAETPLHFFTLCGGGGGIPLRSTCTSMLCNSLDSQIKWPVSDVFDKQCLQNRSQLKEEACRGPQFQGSVATCYTWRALETVADLLRYAPRRTQTSAFGGGASRVWQVPLTHPEAGSSSEGFHSWCAHIMAEGAQ